MSDLISRSDLIEAFDENDLFLPEVVKKLIENQPTAFDVDKVVKELEEKRTCEDFGTCNYCQYRWCPLELLDADETIDIVKRGRIKQRY